MDWRSCHEISPVIIRFEDGQGRAIFLNGSQYFWNTRTSAFCQVQLFEELSDPAVTVAARHTMTGSEVVQIDGSVGAGIAGDSNAIGEDADFDGLPDLITTMIGRTARYRSLGLRPSVLSPAVEHRLFSPFLASLALRLFPETVCILLCYLFAGGFQK